MLLTADGTAKTYQLDTKARYHISAFTVNQGKTYEYANGLLTQIDYVYSNNANDRLDVSVSESGLLTTGTGYSTQHCITSVVEL